MENNENLFAGTFQLDDFQKALGYKKVLKDGYNYAANVHAIV